MSREQHQSCCLIRVRFTSGSRQVHVRFASDLRQVGIGLATTARQNPKKFMTNRGPLIKLETNFKTKEAQ